MGWTLAGPQGEGSCGQCSLWLSCLIPAASPSHCTLTLEEVRDPTGWAGRQGRTACVRSSVPSSPVPSSFQPLRPPV